MLVFKFSHTSTAETCLKCKNIGNIKLFIHSNSCSTILESIHRESTWLKWEEVTDLRKNIRENSSSMRLFLDIISIHKNILPSRMTMQIAVKHELSILGEWSYQPFDGKIHWMENPRWCLPASIEILSWQRTPVVTIDYTIWIENWNYFENKVVS